MKSSTKFVLVALADCVNADQGEMVCWPSARHLADITGQDVKTVEACLQRLRDADLIRDTGQRRGMTGQVIVYRLNTTENGGASAVVHNSTENGGASQRNTPEIGGVVPVPLQSAMPVNAPESGGLSDGGNTPAFPGKTPVFSAKDHRFSGPTPPKAGDGTRKEPGKEQGKKTSATAPHLPGVPDQLLADYLAVRKAKKAGPLTPTAIAGLSREAGKAGLTLAQAVTVCCERGWQSFKADWHVNAAGAAGRRGTAPEGRHAAAARTIFGPSEPPRGDFIDA